MRQHVVHAIRLPGWYVVNLNPYGFLEPKPANVFRIFVVGESAAYGDWDPAYSFARYLEVMLRNRFAEWHFEIINASITASNLRAMFRMAEELPNIN